MTTTLTTRALEGSTYVVNASFKDEEGAAEIPATITWTLTDEDGAVVNARTAVAIAVPAASNDIVLSGADLVTGGREIGTLILTVNATYNSGLGLGLPLKGQVRIDVDGLEP